MFARAIKQYTFFEDSYIYICKLHKKTDFLDTALSYLLLDYQ